MGAESQRPVVHPSEGGALRTGFAGLTGDETAAEVVARADSH